MLFRSFADGMGIFDIAAKLNTLGHKTAKGNKFAKQTISNILHNYAYIGKIKNSHFPDQILDGIHPPLISDDLWERVVKRFEGRGVMPQKKLKYNPAFPLTVTMQCHKCGSPMSGSLSRSKTGKRYPYYHCRKKNCKSKNLQRDPIEKRFEKVLAKIEPTEECIKVFEETHKRICSIK